MDKPTKTIFGNLKWVALMAMVAVIGGCSCPAKSVDRATFDAVADEWLTWSKEHYRDDPDELKKRQAAYDLWRRDVYADQQSD